MKISIDYLGLTQTSVQDPTGGTGTMAIVDLDPVTPIGPTTLEFEFINVPNNQILTFTAFRYMNTTPSIGLAGTWYKPANGSGGEAPGPCAKGEIFQWVGIDSGTLSIYDIFSPASEGVNYLYVLEWEDSDKNRFICDPKIRNQPTISECT